MPVRTSLRRWRLTLLVGYAMGLALSFGPRSILSQLARNIRAQQPADRGWAGESS